MARTDLNEAERNPAGLRGSAAPEPPAWRGRRGGRWGEERSPGGAARTCRGPRRAPRRPRRVPGPAGGSNGHRRPLTWPRRALRLRARGGLRARAAPAAAAEPGGGRSHPVLAARGSRRWRRPLRAHGGASASRAGAPAPPSAPAPSQRRGRAPRPSASPRLRSGIFPAIGHGRGWGRPGRGRGRSPAGLGGAGGGQPVTKPPARQGDAGMPPRPRLQRPAPCRAPRPRARSAPPGASKWGWRASGEPRAERGTAPAAATLLPLSTSKRHWGGAVNRRGFFKSHSVICTAGYRCHQPWVWASLRRPLRANYASISKQWSADSSTFPSFMAISLLLCPWQWIQDCFHRKMCLQKTQKWNKNLKYINMHKT